MRPIDADALKDTLKKLACNHCPNAGVCASCLLGKFLYVVKSAPTLDVQPVRRSEWRYVNYQTDKTTWITGEFICRKCGKSTPRHMGDNPPDYCQHCGADMREVNTDDV